MERFFASRPSSPDPHEYRFPSSEAKTVRDLPAEIVGVIGEGWEVGMGAGVGDRWSFTEGGVGPRALERVEPKQRTEVGWGGRGGGGLELLEGEDLWDLLWGGGRRLFFLESCIIRCWGVCWGRGIVHYVSI